MDYILDFEKIDKSSLPSVGGKNASLGEMIKAGIRVPPGFAVTTDSYLDFITETGIKDKIFTIISGVDPDDVESLDKKSKKIRSLIVRSSISIHTQEAIEEGYEELNTKCGLQNLPVAVRSS
ncbi:MAG: PEP/pyruvate-binding domain-containing protein, partial [Candidatus Marinimicrobia bacterium]|nr:PEP/pyruvate-binding domain-containing protein [Candidatus Neomarinimicrobiota bacterium]